MWKALGHRYARNLSRRLSVRINFSTLLLFIDPLTCLEIEKDSQIDVKTYLLFASKRKEIAKKNILNFKF